MENKEGFAKLKQLPPTRDFSPVGALPKLEEEEKEKVILGICGWYYLMVIHSEKSSQNQKCFDAASSEMTPS